MRSLLCNSYIWRCGSRWSRELVATTPSAAIKPKDDVHCRTTVAYAAYCTACGRLPKKCVGAIHRAAGCAGATVRARGATGRGYARGEAERGSQPRKSCRPGERIWHPIVRHEVGAWAEAGRGTAARGAARNDDRPAFTSGNSCRTGHNRRLRPRGAGGIQLRWRRRLWSNFRVETSTPQKAIVVTLKMEYSYVVRWSPGTPGTHDESAYLLTAPHSDIAVDAATRPGRRGPVGAVHDALREHQKAAQRLARRDGQLLYLPVNH